MYSLNDVYFSSFEDLKSDKSSKDFLLAESKSSNQRHLWMAYCAIKSAEQLKKLKYKRK